MSMPNEPTNKNTVPPKMPPTPRDFAAPSFSELVPFRSSKINIKKSGLLIPAVVTAVASCILFTLSNFYAIMDVTTAYLLFVIFYAAYVYSGLRKNLIIYAVACAILYFELRTPVLDLFIFVFRTILPGNIEGNGNFIMAFVGHFFGAGMMEESMKAIPGLIGMIIALRSRSTQVVPGQAPASGVLEWLKVQTPLEGMLVGMASGAAFIYVETLFQYVPETVDAVAQQDGAGAGFANGFALMLPRVLQGVIGHMCWAGISGYFIGLTALYPRSMVKLLAVGWVVPAALHGLWNAGSELGQIGKWISAALSLAVFIPCFLKAKQLDTARNGNFVPTESILVGATPVPASNFSSTEAGAVAWGGLAHIFGSLSAKAATAAAAATAASVVQVAAGAAAPPARVPLAPAASSKPQFALANGANRFGIVAGQTIDLAALFPGQGLPPQSLAEVTVNPKDPSLLGLKNLTSTTWAVTTQGGSVANVGKGRNVKLEANEKIAIGDCIILVQTI